MDEREKYTAFSIPRREAQPAKGSVMHIQIGSVKVIVSNDAKFAEIEYTSVFSSAPSAAPAQPIRQRTVDPIREKFFDMRKLASGIPFARNDPGLFYKQAKFMEDFTDDYSGNARFFMYFPCYQHMGYEQLRTYFTWRSKIRLGEILPTSLSYVFLYIYELLSGVGVANPDEGLQKLTSIWNAFRECEQTLDQYLPGWFKDYHIYYALPHSFADFVNQHNLHRYYPDLFLFDANTENSLALWNGISSYDATKSKFYCAGNGALMQDCFSAVLSGVRELCASRHRRIEDLLTEGNRRKTTWVPFQRALFYPWLKQPDRQVEMPGQEIYTCKDDRWALKKTEPYWERKEIAGYLIKKTEACLRQAVKYKYKITVNPDAFQPSLRKLTALNIPLHELDAVIEKAVSDFYRNLNRTVVTVDHDNLNRIREEALGTQDKLIVPEEDAPPVSVTIPDEPLERADPVSDGWAALKAALNPAERQALSIALSGGMDMKAFAAENGVMLEVLMDSINEKAVDYIGDNLMEFLDGPAIYDEYLEKVVEMVR